MESVRQLMDESEDEEQEQSKLVVRSRAAVPVQESSEPEKINKGNSAKVPEQEITPSPAKVGEMEPQRTNPQALEKVPGVVDISNSSQVSDAMIHEANMLEGQQVDFHSFFDGLEGAASKEIPDFGDI